MTRLRVLNNEHQPPTPPARPAPPSASILSALRDAAPTGRVDADTHTRGLYATDASLYEVMPTAVVTPGSTAEAADALRVCIDHRLAVLPRGGGTSLAGQCVNEAVVMDLSAHCRAITRIDVQRRECDAEPGVVVDELNRELARLGTGLFFAPDPATVAQATVAGCIGNNAAGARSILYGRTSENVLAVDTMLMTGERVTLKPGAGRDNPTALRLARGVADIVRPIIPLIRERFPKTIRRNAGYGLDLIAAQLERGVTEPDFDLSGLLCGSEGTLAVTLGATLRLHPAPRARGLALISFVTLEEAIDAVPAILTTRPSAVELLDDVVLDAARANAECRRYLELLPTINARSPGAVLYVEYSGFADAATGSNGDPHRLAEQEIIDGFARLRALLPRAASIEYRDAASMTKAWALRKAGEPLLHGLSATRKPVTFVEDNAVPVERLAEFVREFKKIVARHNTRAAYWAHASVGVLHIRPMIDLHDERDRAAMRAIAVEAADLARSVGGVMSGEHGDGRVRGPLLERFFGPELMLAFRRIKAVFDPLNLLNPGNIVAPGPIESITQHLRVGEIGRQRNADHVDTFFAYADQGGFGGAIEMCNGAGVCRRMSGGTMCPSYRATLDERHVPRGRANALRLAIEGDAARLDPPVAGHAARWSDPATIDSLDLCLSCKACKAECPSSVDIARLKAEYTAQRYRSLGRTPLRATLMGNIRRINMLGSSFPSLANHLASRALSKTIAERTLGISRARSLPRFARSLYALWDHAAPTSPAEPLAQHTPKVVLFGDCFTAFNEPHIGLAARRVLERLGYHTLLSPRGGPIAGGGCCGRALISMGALPQAIDEADRTLELLRPLINDDSVVAFAVCEPSCLSAIKDDWLDLKLQTPIDLRRRLADRAILVEHLVQSRAADHPRTHRINTPPIDAPVLLHGHCHQKALWGAETSAAPLRMACNRVQTLDSGCCGMAGSFGYDRDKFDLSMKIGELSLMPALRSAPVEALIAAPGTSCRHQIRDATGRHALHPIELIDQWLGQSLQRDQPPV